MILRYCSRAIFLSLFVALSICGQEVVRESEQIQVSGISAIPEIEQPKLTIIDGVILGVVEGITEYLPISSTGHLIITNMLLGLDDPTPVTDRDGAIIWRHAPSVDNAGVPYTFKDAADAYAIVIQAGAIAAVLLLYWKRVASMAFGFLGRNPQGFRLGINLLIAFMPAVVLGLRFDDWIEQTLFGIYPVIFALVAGGILMIWVERWRKKKDALALVDETGRDLHSLRPLDAFIIGLLHCVAMWPGPSRSRMTIVGGYLVGLRPAVAAEFSFLLGLITLTAAAGYKTFKDGDIMIAVLDPVAVVVGCVVAFISALLAVKWLVGFLTRHGLSIFGWYRIALAGILLYFALQP